MFLDLCCLACSLAIASCRMFNKHPAAASCNPASSEPTISNSSCKTEKEDVRCGNQLYISGWIYGVVTDRKGVSGLLKRHKGTERKRCVMHSCKPYRHFPIHLWKAAGVFIRPNGILFHWYRKRFVFAANAKLFVNNAQLWVFEKPGLNFPNFSPSPSLPSAASCNSFSALI